MRESNFKFALNLYFLLVLLSSCNSNRWRHVEIISPDTTDTISIITIENDRYIIPGSYSQIPKANYAKVDISTVDPIGDEIGICWKENGYKWMLVSAYSNLVENKLDTTNFKILKGLKLDEKGYPTFAPFDNKIKCASIMVRENQIEPTSNGFLLYK